jgi:integrase
MENHKLPENPAKKLRTAGTRAEKMAADKSKERKRYLTDDKLTRLAEAVPPRYAALVRLVGRVGLRPGEALALRVGKFDPLRRKLIIDTSVSGFTKTGVDRELTLPSTISDELVQHLADYIDPANPEALMFPSSRDDRMLTVNGWRHIFQRATSRAGLPEELTPNDLRHSAVSWAINLGANVYAVQRMVGHAKPSITLDVYGELWSEDADKLAEKMDDALRGLSPTGDARVVALT